MHLKLQTYEADGPEIVPLHSHFYDVLSCIMTWLQQSRLLSWKWIVQTLRYILEKLPPKSDTSNFSGAFIAHH